MCGDNTSIITLYIEEQLVGTKQKSRLISKQSSDRGKQEMTNVIFFFNSLSPFHFQLPKPPPFITFINSQNRTSANSATLVDKTLIGAVSGVLSFGLLFHSPLSVALDYSSVETFSLSADSLPSSSPSTYDSSCNEDELREFGNSETGSSPATNEDIVREAWEIVNDSFLDAGRHRWSPEAWKVKLPPGLSDLAKFLLHVCQSCASLRSYRVN